MQNISNKNKFMPKSIIISKNLGLNFKHGSTLRSYPSKLVDLIPLNQIILSDISRSEKID